MKDYVIYITLIILSVGIYLSKINDANIYEDNYSALQDSTTYYKNKLGQTVATKLALQLTKKQLLSSQKNNKTLKLALKKFKKPIIVIETEQVVTIDTFYVKEKDTVKCYFNLINKQTIVGGQKKQNFFKNPQLMVDIINSNPKFTQKNIKPTFLVYKRAWYEKPYITIPLGFLISHVLKTEL